MTTAVFETKTIEEVIEILIDYRGKTPPKAKEGIKLITAKVIKDGWVLEGNHEYITEETYKLWMTRGFPHKRDVLITTEAPLGEVAQLRTSEKVALAQRVILLRGKPKILSQEYLLYALKTPFVQRQLYERAASTTVLGIKQSELIQVKIPYFPLAEQKRIAAILEKCDRLRRTRRYALQLSDTLLQSVFLEMFGNPMANPMGWDKVTLSDIQTDFIYGTSTKCSYQKNGLPVLRIPNILGGEINTSDIKYAKLPDKEVKQLLLHQGDIVFVRTNGNLDYVGRCAVFNLSTSYLFASYLIRARLNLKKVNPWFLSAYIQTPLGRQIMSPFIRTTAGQFNISVEGLKQITIPLPPLPLQEKFAQTVQKFERLRTQQREAERQAEHLFQTLLHRAFRGELTSSDFNDEAVSVLSQEIRAQQTKPKSTADAAEYLRTKGKPQDTEAIQLTLPGLE